MAMVSGGGRGAQRAAGPSEHPVEHPVAFECRPGQHQIGTGQAAVQGDGSRANTVWPAPMNRLPVVRSSHCRLMLMVPVLASTVPLLLKGWPKWCSCRFPPT